MFSKWGEIFRKALEAKRIEAESHPAIIEQKAALDAQIQNLQQQVANANNSINQERERTAQEKQILQKQIADQQAEALEQQKKIERETKLKNGLIDQEFLEEFEELKVDCRGVLGFDETKLNVAVTGRVSSGKSAILNALLKEFQSKLKAKTGISETTSAVKSYAYSPEISIWDFPGVGGSKFKYEGENLVFLSMLNSMDIILFIHDGVDDASTELNFNFIRTMSPRKVILLNKADQLVTNLSMDDDLTIEEATLKLEGSAMQIANRTAAEKSFLVSAQNVALNQRRGTLHQELNMFQWNDFLEYLVNE